MRRRKSMPNRKVLLPTLSFFTIFLCGLPLLSVDGFSEHLEAAEEENQFDDRTYLDMFGEGAKEFLTKQVVSDQFRWIAAMHEYICVYVYAYRSSASSTHPSIHPSIQSNTHRSSCRFQKQMPTADGIGVTHDASLTATVRCNSNGAIIISDDPVGRDPRTHPPIATFRRTRPMPRSLTWLCIRVDCWDKWPRNKQSCWGIRPSSGLIWRELPFVSKFLLIVIQLEKSTSDP